MEPTLLDRIKGNQGHVWSLIKSSCHIYIYSSEIVGNINEDYYRVRDYEMKGWDYYHISVLMPYYNIICFRYVNEIFDPQIKLFPNDNLDPIQEYESWFWHKFSPIILTNHNFIQRVLKLIKLVYSRNPDAELAKLNLEMMQIEIKREYELPRTIPLLRL